MLRRVIRILFVYLLFWMGVFSIQRLLFVLCHFGMASDSRGTEIAGAFFYGLVHDISMTGYLLCLPFILLSFYLFICKDFLLSILRVYFILAALITSALSLADLELYAEWGVKVNVRAILFLEHPAEALETVRTSFLLASVLVLSVVGLATHLIINKIHRYRQDHEAGTAPRSYLLPALFIFLTPPLLFLGIRGGWAPIPVQVSDVYFSKNQFLNVAATNTTWQLMSGIMENRKVMMSNSFHFYPDAEQTVQKIHQTERDSTQFILNKEHPNIVLIIMEGISSEVVGALGGIDGITPYFDQLCREGLLFDSLYASGNLSDQGMSSIFSGFPAQPHVSITSQPDKFGMLPSLNKKMKAVGFHSTFLFGGELTYGNIRAYMMWNEFDRVLESRDFPGLPRGKLGIHDGEMFRELLKVCQSSPSPWFNTLFTGSTHSPYDHPPVAAPYTGEHEESRYVHSVHYFDQELKKFIESARKEPWFNNTLFVFISDHSHRTPKGTERYMAEYRRIPFLLWGEVLNDSLRGRTLHRISSQTDLAATLLAQYGIDYSEFHWSKNLFNPYTPEFAFFENTDGFGWIRPGEHVVWSPAMKDLWRDRSASAGRRMTLLKEGKSYLQILWEEYLEK
ncbi:MAG: LTA synthase family protein [Bacteroidia bacterium]|nr:LTA synthase family protein [Bacteroidia bacterium]